MMSESEDQDYENMKIVSMPVMRHDDRDMAIKELREWAAREFPKGTWYEIRLTLRRLMPRPHLGTWQEMGILIPLPESNFTDKERLMEHGWYPTGGYYFIERSQV
jgi:hypothetical protein